MSPEPTDGSLYEVFSEIPDPRHRRGTVYPLAAVLTLVATAMLCGCRSLAAIAQWGRDYNHLAPNSASPAGPGTRPAIARPAPASSTPSWPRCRPRCSRPP